MVDSAGDALCALHAVDAHGMKEGCGEIGLALRIDAVAFHSSGGMYIVAVVVVDCNVCDTPGPGIAEKEQVAGLAVTPVFSLDACTG